MPHIAPEGRKLDDRPKETPLTYMHSDSGKGAGSLNLVQEHFQENVAGQVISHGFAPAFARYRSEVSTSPLLLVQLQIG
jgi:hypothetical protein